MGRLRNSSAIVTLYSLTPIWNRCNIFKFSSAWGYWGNSFFRFKCAKFTYFCLSYLITVINSELLIIISTNSAFHEAVKPWTSTVFRGAYQPRAIHSYGGFSGIIPGKLMNGREAVNPLALWIALLMFIELLLVGRTAELPSHLKTTGRNSPVFSDSV